jgi:hypothetical protein
MKNGKSYGGKVVHQLTANTKHPNQQNQFYSTVCLPGVSFFLSHMRQTDEPITCKRCIKASEK